MRRQSSSGSGNLALYALLLVGACAALWILSSSPESYSKSQGAAGSKVIEVLMEENQRLTAAVEACGPAAAGRSATAQKCDCGAEVASLQAEIASLKAKLSKVRHFIS